MNTVRIETLGCKLNQIESESAARYFSDCGFDVKIQNITSQTPSDNSTILCILNTCTVTQKAEQKARRIIRLLLKKYQNSVVIVTGCYAQLSASEILAMDKRICVIEGQIKSRLSVVPAFLKDLTDYNPVDLARKIYLKIHENPQIQNIAEDSFRFSTSSFIAHSRASLKIQDGCNNCCSFCAIHFARGTSVSLDVDEVLKRVCEIEQKGNDEVVLTAINIAQYRGKIVRDGIEDYYNFSELLLYLLENTNTIRFRISSLYPEIVDDRFLKAIESERVCPHFHLSVQSGSDKILQMMNRKYVYADVLQACRKIREVRKNCFLACDIITGFPGETDEDFNRTLSLCRECDFTWIHAFPFSERKGTKACELKPKVAQSVSQERSGILTNFAIKNKIKYIKGFKNHVFDAVLESIKPSMIQNGFIKYHAVTDNFIHCEIVSDKNLPTCRNVKIRIKDVLEQRIKKGGDIEASAEFC
ncbi:MAG: tRNA (N(6)-L-threonylcarbamoyladenosine(37)-C(2))-methylthiotransferase MtaB [Treponema sp.]|nr:tRNA (N(6)-L-threonylcarbamoyladenosine(37)-C(2))-methylthiotransferase MtaB [Treponema sp.]